MLMRSQPKLNKLQLSINTDNLHSEPDSSVTSDHRKRFMRKPEGGLRPDSSRNKKNHCQVKAISGFFSPNNQQLTEIIREKSTSDLRKLLFRNIHTPQNSGYQEAYPSSREQIKPISEQVLNGLNKSLYQLRSQRRQVEQQKENYVNNSFRRISQGAKDNFTENENLKFEIQKLKDENADLRARLAHLRKQLTDNLKKETPSQDFQMLYKKATNKLKEANQQNDQSKLKIIRLQAQIRTKQEVITMLQRTVGNLNERLEGLTQKQHLFEQELSTSQQKIHRLSQDYETASCKLWVAQQKNVQVDFLRAQARRNSNIIAINRQLKIMNQQLLRKIERMQVVRDHELFSLSSDEEESY